MKHASRQTPRSPYSDAANGLSITTGIIVAFLLAPQVYGFGAQWVGAYTAAEYGAGLVELTRILFLCVAAYFLFCLSRLICMALFSTLGLWLGTVLLTRSRKGQL